MSVKAEIAGNLLTQAYKTVDKISVIVKIANILYTDPVIKKVKGQLKPILLTMCTQILSFNR